MFIPKNLQSTCPGQGTALGAEELRETAGSLQAPSILDGILISAQNHQQKYQKQSLNWQGNNKQLTSLPKGQQQSSTIISPKEKTSSCIPIFLRFFPLQSVLLFPPYHHAPDRSQRKIRIRHSCPFPFLIVFSYY